MIALTITISVLVCLYLFIWQRSKTLWWEYLIMCAIPLLFITLASIAVLKLNSTGVEYRGYYARYIIHYEDWDEWVQQTCYRTISTGKTTVSIPYDCSYRVYHPETWKAYFVGMGETEITPQAYAAFASAWGTPPQHIDCHRNYYRKNGNAEQYKYNGDRYQALTLAQLEYYENKIRASRSLYNLHYISLDEAKNLNLYPIPGGTQSADFNGVTFHDHNAVFGLPTCHCQWVDSIQAAFRYINGFYGSRYQFRMYVCLFPSGGVERASQQRDYWVGGNKNEMVLCIGTDSMASTVRWVNTFSWCDNTELEAAVKSFVLSSPQLNLNKVADFTRLSLIKGLWHRKSFADFSYLDVEFTPNQFFIIISVMLLVQVLTAIFIIYNKYRK